MQKLLTFFSKNISVYAIFNDQNFNDTLTNDIVNFWTIGPRLSTNPTIRLVWPVKTQISLLICTVWSESLLIVCAFYSLQAIQRGLNENPWHTGWICRLISVFAGYTDLIAGFDVHWFILYLGFFRLTFTTLLPYSVNNKLITFLFLFPANSFWHFIQIISRQFAWNVKAYFLKKKKKKKKKSFKMPSAETVTQSAKH